MACFSQDLFEFTARLIHYPEVRAAPEGGTSGAEREPGTVYAVEPGKIPTAAGSR